MTTYQIIRFYFAGERRVIQTGLTREEAQEHCNDPETSSRTCSTETSEAELAETGHGTWFDGFEEE